MDWIKVIKDLRSIGNINLCEAKACMDYIRDNFVPKSALNEKQPLETVMGYTLAELKQVINFAKTRGFCPEPEEKQEVCECKQRISDYYTMLGKHYCNDCKKPIKPQPKKIEPLQEDDADISWKDIIDKTRELLEAYNRRVEE